MSDDLTISGAGSAAVATDELYANAQQLRGLAREAATLRMHLASIDGLISMSALKAAGAPAAAARAERDIDQARIVLAEIEVQARVLDFSLNTVADGYGFVELFVSNLVGQFSGELGGVLGRLLPVLATSAGAGGLLIGAAAGLNAARAGATDGSQGTRRSGGGGSSTSWARENNGLVTNPLTASLVRTAAQSMGDLTLGAAGLPSQVAGLVPSGAAFALAARSVMGGGSMFGVLAETSVRQVSSQPQEATRAPQGFAERLDRVPDTDETGGAQVVVERYAVPGEPDRFEVYVAGTVTFSTVADSEPWDMTSNLANAAGEDGGSYASVVQAMDAAGVEPDSPVQFTGYSQGGGTAARLAASGDYNTQGLATFGGPTGQIPIPESVPAVLVEHTDDIVPALGGQQANHAALYVRRDVFGGEDIPTQYAVPAHHYEYYQETAQLMDQAKSDQVTEAAARLDGFTDGARLVSSTAYRYERTPSS